MYKELRNGRMIKQEFGWAKVPNLTPKKPTKLVLGIDDLTPCNRCGEVLKCNCEDDYDYDKIPNNDLL